MKKYREGLCQIPQEDIIDDPDYDKTKFFPADEVITILDDIEDTVNSIADSINLNSSLEEIQCQLKELGEKLY